MVQWLRLCISSASTVGGIGSSPWSGNYDPTCHAEQQKKKKKKERKGLVCV